MKHSECWRFAGARLDEGFCFGDPSSGLWQVPGLREIYQNYALHVISCPQAVLQATLAKLEGRRKISREPLKQRGFGRSQKVGT